VIDAALINQINLKKAVHFLPPTAHFLTSFWQNFHKSDR